MLFDELDLNQLLKDDFFEALTKDDSNGKFYCHILGLRNCSVDITCPKEPFYLKLSSWGDVFVDG